MRKVYRTLSAIEYAFVCSMIASFSVVGVAGLFFGFQMSQWSEWQGALVGVTGSIAGLVGAVLGVRLALDTERLSLKHRTNQIAGRHQTH